MLFQSESGNNDEGYKSPEFDALVAQAGAEPDAAKSLALYNQAQELLVEDAPAVFTRWRITNFLRHASEILDPDPILDPIRKALATVETHSKRILQRWTSSHSNARLEGLNGLFQAARARARGYRNVTTFATMIYMIAAPLGDLFQST